MSEHTYRVAVVGGAGMWGRHYLRTYAEHPRCEVVGLVDRARDRRDEFARRYSVTATFDSVEELLARTVPDVVSAVVPVGQNHPVVTACARAGVRVVSCEKPISASLAEADDLVETCRRHGTLLGCAQAAWATPYLRQVVDWVQAGKIGALTAAAIPGGLPVEMSGAGCVQLAALRLATHREVEWVEGWELPPVPGYVAPGTAPLEADVPAYGRLGLTGGIVCEVVRPEDESRMPTFLSLTGENGQVWLARPRPVLVQGTGARSTPVFPDFLQGPSEDFFGGTIQRLLDAFDSGEEPVSSGDDYRHSLETAIALKLSAADGHRRVTLPLADRSHRLLPHPYRLFGGDVAGWQSIGYPGPPRLPAELRAIASFDEVSSLTQKDLERLLRAVLPADLALVLQGSGRVLQKRALAVLTEDGRALVRRLLESAGATAADPREVETAQHRILETARRL